MAFKYTYVLENLESDITRITSDDSCQERLWSLRGCCIRCKGGGH